MNNYEIHEDEIEINNNVLKLNSNVSALEVSFNAPVIEIKSDSKKISVIILDCTNIQFIDESGFKSLSGCIAEYSKSGIRIVLTNCHG